MGKKRKSLCRRRRLPRGAIEASESRDNNAMPFDLISGKFITEKSNIWRDCVDGYYDWVKEHIAEGAPLNEADHCGDPPLLLAAGNGHLACVRLLLDEGADIEQRGVTKETPLNRAAHNGHLQTVMFLVEKGADENCKSLIECGADKNMRNKQDKIPVDLCKPC